MKVLPTVATLIIPWLLAWICSAQLPQCREVAHVNDIIQRKHWHNSNVTLLYGNNDDYKLVKRLGAGAFAEGYLGYNSKHNFPCLIKIYHNEDNLPRVFEEILILQSLCGGPNIMKIFDVLLEKSERKPAVVFEYVNGTDFDVFMKKVKDKELRFYMKELLKAIAFTHKSGVIHRDIKPSNVKIDMAKKEARLIDFSLARYHYEGNNHSAGGTPHYKAPEILLGNKMYGFPVDMWSFGCMVAGIVFQREPFFHGQDIHSQIAGVAKFVGSKNLRAYVKSEELHYNKKDPAFQAYNETDLSTLVNSKNKHLATDLAIDALSKILVVDPNDRMTAAQALRHPYFDI